MEHANLPVPIRSKGLQISHNGEYIATIQAAIENSAKDIKRVSKVTASIKAQGGLESFWKKGANIQALAVNLGTVASVQQRTLDMLILLMSASGRMKKDYHVIIESIEELGKSHAGSVEVLDYLVKIKNTVEVMRRRDELLESLCTYTNDLRDTIETVESNVEHTLEEIADKTTSVTCAQNDLRNRVVEIESQQERYKAEQINRIDRLRAVTDEQLSNLRTNCQRRFRIMLTGWVLLAAATLLALGAKVL